MFNLDQSKILSPGNGSLSNDKLSDRLKLKAPADNNVNVTEKNEICFGKGRKHSGKRIKCRLSAFSPFPTMFSNSFLFKVVKSRDFVVKGCQIKGKNAGNQQLLHFSSINRLPDMPVLGFSNSAENKKITYDVKKMDKWGYNYLIE